MAKDIQTTLNYAKEDGARPYFYATVRSQEDKNASPHKQDYGGSHSSVDILVKDGRSQQLSLDIHSFQLVAQKTKLSTDDFYTNSEKITKDYYEEMKELFKKTTGAAHVIVWHHQVRNDQKMNGGPQNLNTSIQGYANGIHSDSHPDSAEQLFKQRVIGLDKKYRKGRFLYINAWRNISETPIGNNHLAVCDETSLVKPDDYITSDLFFSADQKMQQYRLLDRNSAQHRWYYFSNMKKDEVILFKQWDSDTTLSGRVTFHTAFKDLNAPKDTPVRESIETRALCFFPDHEPNTCPIIEDVVEDGKFDEKRVHEGVKKILAAFDSVNSWPAGAQSWLKNTDIETIVKMLIEDGENHFGLKGGSTKTKARAYALLLEEKNIERIKAAIAKLNKNSHSSIRFPSNVLPVAVGCTIGWTFAYLFYQRGGMSQWKKIKKSLW